MISFFILFTLTILLLYSEYIGNIKRIITTTESFSDFEPNVINLGLCGKSLTQNRNKFNGNKVINPFNNSTDKPFSWDNYFNNANFKVEPVNNVYL